MSDELRPPVAARAMVGTAPGQPRLDTAGVVRPLGTTPSVLPELAEAPQAERKWWRHPAFIVSIGLTVLALLGLAAWLIVAALTDDSVRVTGLEISDDGGNVHLTWSDPHGDVALYAVHGDGEVVDLTQWVHGDEAWIPAATALYESDTCFVVRPASTTDDVSLDAATLGSQRGQGACVADLGA
ncbi:hypothetical protein LQ757_04975 [Agromyces sp. SYSU K20354]|uniref:hypothetical protein n=1 Tax=Agromyces cavernae TaxID=2898659 RepID=UPI001E2AC45B|nr:hypothetical protein [Agromyces cavernae]MCD2441625.1 hypothetical protein [Agromyces cavernae]